MSQFTVPGGDDKGKPLNAAQEKSLTYWADRLEKGVRENPNGRGVQRDRLLAEAMRAELKRRAEGGAIVKAAPAPIQPAAVPPPFALLGRAVGDAAAVTASLEKLSATYHLVSPATRVDVLPPGCGVSFSALMVDPKPGNGDVYKQGEKLALTGVLLSKIWAAANGSWDTEKSGRLDDGSERHYCHYRAVGIVTNFDGTERVVSGEVELDMREGGADYEEIVTKAKQREAAPDYEGKRDGGAAQILEVRKFLLRHAERKAKNRAVTELGLARAYTKDQLAKPFAITRLIFTGESDDPELRRIFAEKTADAMLTSRLGLYGKPSARLPPPAAPIPAPRFTGTAPPPLMPRPTVEASSEPAPERPVPPPAAAASAPAPSDNGAPSPEELAASDRAGSEEYDAQADTSLGDDDIPFILNVTRQTSERWWPWLR